MNGMLAEQIGTGETAEGFARSRVQVAAPGRLGAMTSPGGPDAELA